MSLSLCQCEIDFFCFGLIHMFAFASLCRKGENQIEHTYHLSDITAHVIFPFTACEHSATEVLWVIHCIVWQRPRIYRQWPSVRGLGITKRRRVLFAFHLCRWIPRGFNASVEAWCGGSDLCGEMLLWWRGDVIAGGWPSPVSQPDVGCCSSTNHTVADHHRKGTFAPEAYIDVIFMDFFGKKMT